MTGGEGAGATSDWYDHEPVTQGRLDAAWLAFPAGLLGLVVAGSLAYVVGSRLRRMAAR